MKKLEKAKFDKSQLLNANQLSGVAGGGWTENKEATYVGANGDTYHGCDSYGGDVCSDDDSYTVMH